MSLDPAELLTRLSATLKTDIGPAVDDEYLKTQTFMASVIVSKLAKQVELEPAHRAAERADVDRLLTVLTAQEWAGPENLAPGQVTSALAVVESSRTVASLGPLVAALHQVGADDPGVALALAAIRPVLRRDIDRRMEIAR